LKRKTAPKQLGKIGATGEQKKLNTLNIITVDIFTSISTFFYAYVIAVNKMETML
jgi:hypothetical protein